MRAFLIEQNGDFDPAFLRTKQFLGDPGRREVIRLNMDFALGPTDVVADGVGTSTIGREIDADAGFGCRWGERVGSHGDCGESHCDCNEAPAP